MLLGVCQASKTGFVSALFTLGVCVCDFDNAVGPIVLFGS